jgi:putative membrane protein
LKEGGLGFSLWAVLVFASTFVLEVIGVATGLVFGSYSYGTVLGFHILKVPPVIGFNWVLIISGFCLLVQELIPPRPVSAEPPTGRRGPFAVLSVLGKSLLVALFATAFDFLLEPVAIRLGYWVWEGGLIPLSNYLSWFFIAFGAAILYFVFRVRLRNRVLMGYVLIQAVYFAILGFPGLLSLG